MVNARLHPLEERSAKNCKVIMRINKKNLFLDDFRKPSDVTWATLPSVDWDTVRSVDSFKKWINKQGVPALVSFDNDLLPHHYVDNNLSEKGSGFEACKWLVSICELSNIAFPEWIVHSRNTRGVRRMVDLLLRTEISWDKGITWSYKSP